MNFLRAGKKYFIIAIFLLVVSTLFIGFNNTYDFKISKNLDIFFNLFREVSLYYVDEIDPEKLISDGIEGMLESLDPYTEYIPESEMKDFKFQTTGKYGGIGALIRKSDKYIIISEPYEGFPAFNAGLLAGDKLIKVNGKSMIDMNIKDVSEHLKGIPNSECKITVKRAISDEVVKVTIKRQEISISDVPYYGELVDGVGYIRLSGFTQGASDEVKEALLSLKDDSKITSLVLDLRSNPGGLLMEAVKVANLFVKKNQEIVRTKGKVKQWDHIYLTEKEPIDTTIPLIIMVSRGSASASEIVSGSLQDLDRAVIIGQRTFGKGLVQTSRPLSYNAQLKVTTAKYYIPSGRCIQALDYSNRNDDGSVGKVPDSLITEYTTLHGRKVYDGGGIVPDIKINPEKYSKIATSIYAKQLIFDYSVKFAYYNPIIPDINDFEISDSVYTDFKEFIEDKEFDYQTKSEEELEKLIKIAKKEKYYDSASIEFEKLQEKLAHDKNKDLNVFEDEIKELIKEEIATRYYFQKGRIKALLKRDKFAEKAVDVFENDSTYTNILAISIPVTE